MTKSALRLIIAGRFSFQSNCGVTAGLRLALYSQATTHSFAQTIVCALVEGSDDIRTHAEQHQVARSLQNCV